MKRQLVIAIDAEDRRCGECAHVSTDYAERTYVCDVFGPFYKERFDPDATDAKPLNRHPECLAAENAATMPAEVAETIRAALYFSGEESEAALDWLDARKGGG